MSQENVEAFRRGTDAISRGDLVDIPHRWIWIGTYIGRFRTFVAL